MKQPPSHRGMVRNCSVDRTLAILSDAWTFLVLREFYMGARRFEQIQAVLHLPRSTLSNRLASLVNDSVLRKVSYGPSASRFEYRLTDRGRDLYLVMLTLMRFGNRHLAGGSPPPAALVHTSCGHSFEPETLCSHCKLPIVAHQVTYRDGPGAGVAPAAPRHQRRRRNDLEALEAGRPSSVSRTLNLIADRWTFLILREMFFGAHRYDEFGERLGISPSTLSERLARLLDAGVLVRRRYQEAPERFAYHLSSKGRELYLPLIEMLRWGDRWLGHDAPLVLNHRECGCDFQPLVACSVCKQPIQARDVTYALSYDLPTGAAKPRALRVADPATDRRRQQPGRHERCE